MSIFFCLTDEQMERRQPFLPSDMAGCALRIGDGAVSCRAGR